MANAAIEQHDPNLLSAIAALMKETVTHVNRIKALAREGIDHETLTDEIVETFLPLLADTVTKVYEVQEMMQRFGDDVAAELWPEEGDGPDDGESDSALLMEDAEILKSLLADYRSMLSSVESNTEDTTAKQELLRRLGLVDRAVARIDEITIEESEDEPEEPDTNSAAKAN